MRAIHETDSIDAAFMAAEAALPDGVHIQLHHAEAETEPDGRYLPAAWLVEAWLPDDRQPCGLCHRPFGAQRHVQGEGSTPTKALLDFVVHLERQQEAL